jgi:hypothetical protein
MKIPKTLKIGGHVYKVVIEKPGKMKPDDLGHIDRKANEIVLDGSFPEDQLSATLFHEIFHAINNELTHTLVDSFAEQHYQVYSYYTLL